MKNNINVIFCGTADFSYPTLIEMVNFNDPEYSISITSVVTQPDKPKGRNRSLKYSLIKETAILYKIPIEQPENINDKQVVDKLLKLKPDIIITAAYGGYIGKELRTSCPLGAINLHPSLLPLHRGADPIRSTLLAKDEYCGNTIFFLDAKMDSGPIILQNKYKISNIIENKNFTNIENYLAKSGASDVINVLKLLKNKKLTFKNLKNEFPKQNHKEATYSKKIEKNSTYANFELNAEDFINNIHSYAYKPGYVCKFRGKRLELFSAEIDNITNNEIYPIIKAIIKNKGFLISLKDADILIKEVQFEGKSLMSAWDFNNGMRLQIGERFESFI